VPVVEEDLAKLKEWQAELQETEAHVTRKLMRYAIRNGRAVLGLPPLESGDPNDRDEPGNVVS
jgi:hypothetical protein